MNDNAYLFALGSTLLIFALVLISMMHDKDVKVDCIKSATKEHYSVDDIVKLCGVGK
jgi:hypothetical protein